MEAFFTRLKNSQNRIGKSLSALALAVFCMGGAANAQTYCTPTISSACIYQDDVNSFTMTGPGASLSDLNTGCNNTTTGYVYRFPAIGIQSLAQGQSYSGYITSTYSSNEYYQIWIDFNKDGAFNQTLHSTANPAGEMMFAAPRGPFGSSTGQHNYSFTLAALAASGQTRMRVMVLYGTSSFTACGTYFEGEVHDYLVNIGALQPCLTATPAGTLSPSGTISNVCPGSTYTITASGYPIASGINFQWMYSVNGGTTWLPVVGATNPSITTGAITQNIRYHMVVTCNFGGIDSTGNTIFNVMTGHPIYATLPFSESFESWRNGCGTSDLPSLNWTNNPATGNNSFRRDDQGSTASWTTPTGGVYAPSAAVGTYSARFHNYYAYNVSKGGLSCYVDCSGAIGNKELEFYYLNSPTATYKDSLYVEYSTDGGLTWNLIQRYGPGTGKWDFKSLVLPSNSATTVVRFTAFNAYTGAGSPDQGIDGVRILPPCTAKPTAGKIDSVEACPGKNFTLGLSGTSVAAGLTYQWQFKPTGSTLPWANLAGGNIAKPTANITVPTSFRAIVSCSNLTPTVDDTSAVLDVKLAPFYYCYCNFPSSIQYPQYPYSAIGDVIIKKLPSLTQILSNPTAANHPYMNYQKTVAPPTLIRDSSYRIEMLSISGTYSYTNSNCAFFLDFNRNGIWDMPTERIMNKTSGYPAPNTVFQNFTVPSNAGVGLTGLRGITGYNMTQPTDPCGSFYYTGEAEDYLVYIEYQPCNGPVTAGTSFASDSTLCPGYTLDLWNTTYERQRTGVVRMWEVSTDGGFNYTPIAGSGNKDTLFNVVATASTAGLKYRLRVICSNTGDTTYSNSVTVMNPPASSCYPFASAIPPGTADSSDIGTFEIGSIVNPLPMKVSGPHLGNPAANRRRTDYTAVGPIMLAADSSYRLAVFHTMRTQTHADALVSVFIDFNHDGQYTVASPGYPYPGELIYQGRTTPSDFYLDTVFKMPSTLIGGVPTGLRVVLNNDVNPAGSGNNGTGGFISGEVEDYVVTLSRNNLGVAGTGLIQNLAMYPNPTEGKSTIVFDAPKTIGHLDMIVTTISGQQVMSRSYDNVGARFSAELDMSKVAKGVYFVELRADGEKMSQKLIVR